MNKKIIWVVIAIGAVIAVTAVLLYKKEPPKSEIEKIGESISGSVPEISTNPLEQKVPELNPVDRINPFQYKNPLR